MRQILQRFFAYNIQYCAIINFTDMRFIFLMRLHIPKRFQMVVLHSASPILSRYLHAQVFIIKNDMAQKSYDSSAGWHCQAETSAFIRFLNDCCSAVAYPQKLVADKTVMPKDLYLISRSKTDKTNLSTISCKSVCVYRKITVISIKITYFLPFLPDFRTV